MIFLKSVLVKLTWNENVFIWGTDELHGLLGKDGHVLIGCVTRDILVGTIVECNEDVQKNCYVLALPKRIKGRGMHVPIITTKLKT